MIDVFVYSKKFGLFQNNLSCKSTFLDRFVAKCSAPSGTTKKLMNMVQNQTTSAPGMFTWITITMILALSLLFLLRPLPVTDAGGPFTGPLEFERSAGTIAALFLAVFFICFPLLESGACELEPNPIGLWYCIPSQNTIYWWFAKNHILI